MRPLRRVGLETGMLTDDELQYIDKAIIQTVWPALHAREIFETTPLPNAGVRTIKQYTETDMGDAAITMNGEDINLDRVVLAEGTVSVPVISKEFVLNWRDIEAARAAGMPVDIQHGRNAARQVAEEENKLLFSGEYTGWKALGIEGIMTATSRNTKASAGAWPANVFTDLNATVAELETDGFTQGPYVLLCRVAAARKLDALISSTSITYRKAILENGIVDSIITDDSIYAADGGTDGAAIVVPGKDNFELAIGQDLTTIPYKLPNQNVMYRVFEVVTPRVKRPTSICEITGLT